MPLVTGDDDAVIVPKPIPDVGEVVTTIPIVSDDYRGIAQDVRVTPAHTLMPHIDGSEWTVDYYSQVLRADSPLIQQSPSSSGTIQQYKRIKNLDLRVTTPLTSRQDTETMTMVVEGRGVVYAGIIPNENDVFVAFIGEGLPAVIKVITTEKMSVMNNAAYDISYRVMGQDQDLLDDLVSKTVQTFTYKRDNIAHGISPLVEQAQIVVMDEVAEVVDTLVASYMGEFFDQHIKTFVIPNQELYTYDPYLIEFLKHVLRVGETPILQNMANINTAEDLVYKQPNIWTALIENNPKLLTAGFTRIGFTQTTNFSGHPTNRGLRWTKLVYTAYPKDPRIGYSGLRAENVKLLDDFTVLPSANQIEFYPRQNHAIADNDANQSITPVLIDPVFTTDYYVFSENFYNGVSGTNLFEKEVLACLNNEALDGEQLIRNARNIANWDAVSRFYYAPIILHLLRKHIRSYQNWVA